MAGQQYKSHIAVDLLWAPKAPKATAAAPDNPANLRNIEEPPLIRPDGGGIPTQPQGEEESLKLVQVWQGGREKNEKGFISLVFKSVRLCFDRSNLIWQASPPLFSFDYMHSLLLLSEQGSTQIGGNV